MSASLRTLNVRSGWFFVSLLLAAGQVDAASIRGTVTKEGPAPVVGGQVTAFDLGGGHAADAGTDANGEYAIALSPGDYYLEARGNCGDPSDWRLVPVSYNGHAGSFQFYWSEGRQGELQTVWIDGDDVTDVNFQLLQTGGKVTGNVRSQVDMSTVADVDVRVFDEEGRFVAGGGTDGSGNYVVCGVPPGTYVVDAWGPQGSFHAQGTFKSQTATLDGDIWHADNLAQAGRISVGVGTTSLANFRLPCGGLICGTVEDTTGWPLADVRVTVYDASCRGLPWGAQTDGNGSYCLGPLLAEHQYYLDVRGDPDYGWYYITTSYNGPAGDERPGSVHSYCNSGRLHELQSVGVECSQRTEDIDFHMRPEGVGIGGVVTDADTGEGLGGARIELFLCDENNENLTYWADVTWSDGDGAYSFYGLQPDPAEYVMDVWPPDGPTCFAPVTYHLPDNLLGPLWWGDNPSRATRIVVQSGMVCSDILFPLPRGGTITGKVTQEDDAPIPNAIVKAYDVDETYLTETRTDGNGDYSLCVWLPNCLLDAWGPEGSCYVPQTWAGLPGNLHAYDNRSRAARVHVAPNCFVAAVNFGLDVGGRIRGTIRRPGGEPAEQVFVQIYDQFGRQVNNAGTPSDPGHVGEYEFPLPFGTYYVNARTDQHWSPADTCELSAVTYDGNPGSFDWYRCNERQGELQAIDLHEECQEVVVDLTFPCGGSISGTVTESDGATPIDDAQVTLYDGNRCWVASTQTRDGTYRLCGIPEGTYVMQARGPTGSCYGSVTYDDLQGDLWHGDNLANATRIHVEGTCTPLIDKDFRLPTGARVSGTVTQADGGGPIENAQVTAHSFDSYTPPSSGPAPFLPPIATAQTDTNGEYAFPCLPPGEYVFQACDGANYQCEMYSELPAQLWCDPANAPTAVIVAPGSPISDINFTLDPPRFVLEMVSPDSDDVLQAGQTHEVRWTVNPPDVDDPAFLYLYSGQSGFCLLGLGRLSDGSFPWTVSPFLPEGSYRVGISTLGPCSGGSGDESELFTITHGGAPVPPMPTLTVFAPSSGARWIRGSRCCVRWEVSGETKDLLAGRNADIVLMTPSGIEVWGTAPILGGEFCGQLDCQRPEGECVVIVALQGDYCLLAYAPGQITVTHHDLDCDADCDVDLADFLHFQACFNGPNRPHRGGPCCPTFDGDKDDDVDLADFLGFQRAFNGPNRPPAYSPLTVTAWANPSMVIVGGGTTLSAIVSGGRAPYTYAWLQCGGPPATIENPSAETTPVALPGEGTYTFTLTVIDAMGQAAAAAVTVFVGEPPPAPLVVNAGPDVTIMAGESVPLAAAVTGGTPPYECTWQLTAWCDDGNVILTDAETCTATATFSPEAIGTFGFTVTVRDSTGQAASDSMLVTVTPAPG